MLARLPSRILGRFGEYQAIKYLISQGFCVRASNFYTRWGEIDIVASNQQRIVFVEVKTRWQTTQGQAEEAFYPRKQQRLSRAIWRYLTQQKLQRYEWQLDLITVCVLPDFIFLRHWPAVGEDIRE